MIRLFVAIELPEDVRQRIERMCADVPGARWAEPEQMHLTLRFIGEVDGDVFREIRESLGTVRAEPFEMELRGVGHFPPRGEPRILWVGVQRSEELVRLRNRVESTLVRIGLEPEGRKFSPHITIARLKGTPPRAVGSFLAQHGLFQAGPIAVDGFQLHSSTLGAKRAVYRCEASYSFSVPWVCEEA